MMNFMFQPCIDSREIKAVKNGLVSFVCATCMPSSLCGAIPALVDHLFVPNFVPV